MAWLAPGLHFRRRPGTTCAEGARGPAADGRGPGAILLGGEPMRYEWILDVLTDLRAFARANGLPLLAERLDEAVGAAVEETAGTGAAAAPAEREAP